ncbi:MAG: M23 family metallopeptidase [Shimia sp.]
MKRVFLWSGIAAMPLALAAGMATMRPAPPGPGPILMSDAPHKIVAAPAPAPLDAPAVTRGRVADFIAPPPIAPIDPDGLEALRAALAVPPWTAEFSSGDTLDGLLDDAGIEAKARARIVAAIETEYDIRRLRPGHVLRVEYGFDDSAEAGALEIGDGVEIAVTLGPAPFARRIEPEAQQIVRADALRVEGSIYASLERAGMPTVFSSELDRLLGGIVDMRRDLQGGELVELMWDEEVLPDGTAIGRPMLRYVALDLRDARYEVAWPSAGAPTRHVVYRDGAPVRAMAPPVEDGRLSSVFGMRRHPVFGDMRMHTGMDFAARRGTPVNATAAGRISFVGWRGGYGRVVEIDHGGRTMSRYAHLDATTEGLSVGDTVMAGDRIGSVGQTGTATGPNLHYEVRVEGRPVDPAVRDDHGTQAAFDTARLLATLRQTRASFSETLDRDA